MSKPIDQLEYEKFTTDTQGRESVRLQSTTGDNGQQGMDISTLRYNAFTTDDAGNTAVRVVGAGGSGGTSCTVESSVSIQSTNWKDGTTLLNSSINFTQTNTGFRIVYKAGSGNIIALCGNTLVTPLATTSGAMGDLSLDTMTLNGVDITSEVTTSLNDEVLTVDYDTPIENPNLSSDNLFTVVGNLQIGETTVPPLTSVLTYRGPVENLSISTDARLFDTTYTTASIARSFPNGSQTSIDETIFGGVVQTAGATSITFTALDRNATVAQRTLSEKVTYTNPTKSPVETLQITTTAILMPVIQFPVYLGNESSMATPTATRVNTYQKSGTFTSFPGDQSFTWSDPLDDSLSNKVFAIRTTFFSGEIHFQENAMSTLFNDQVPFANVNIGDISTATENYSLYRAAADQPGEVTYYVDFV